jgi:uncharacterized protein (TIGR02646 family)
VRKFDRADPPAAWVENEAKWNQQWVELLQRNAKAAFAWYSHEGSSARDIALPHLKRQTGEHCSFCDGFPVEGVSVDTIEHFRPKCASRFPQHAYTWSNLYYCCGCCQSEKGDQWDDGLLAPDDPEYTFQRYFEFDFTTGAIRPSTIASDADKRRAEVTISMYGLDTDSRRRFRRLELKKWLGAKTKERVLDESPYRDYLESARGVRRG